MNNDTQQLKKVLLESLHPDLSVGIMSHVEPDGDGFCASVALQRFLREWDIESEILVDPDSKLERFDTLMQDAKLQIFDGSQAYDLLIILDCNSYSRINARAEAVKNSRKVILVDHHVPENEVIETDYSFVDTNAVSAGAILFDALKDEIRALSPKARISVASCIYVSILNDTNNFINSNTNSRVFRLSAELADLGISPAQIYKRFFLNHAALEMRFVGEVLSTIELHHGGRILIMHSTLQMQRQNDLDAESIMNITRWVQGVRDIDIVAYFREDKPGEYKLSLRSPWVDVNAVAASYGGGGHKSASGATLQGSLESLKTDLLNKLTTAMNKYPDHA